MKIGHCGSRRLVGMKEGRKEGRWWRWGGGGDDGGGEV